MYTATLAILHACICISPNLHLQKNETTNAELVLTISG